MIKLRLPPTLEAAGCIFRRLVDGEAESCSQVLDGCSLYALLQIQRDECATQLFHLPRMVEDLCVSGETGSYQIRTCGDRLKVVPREGKLNVIALDSFLLFATDGDAAVTRASCISRIRNLKTAFPRIYAHVLPTIVGDNQGSER
jgi:hypothetical protein